MGALLGAGQRWVRRECWEAAQPEQACGLPAWSHARRRSRPPCTIRALLVALFCCACVDCFIALLEHPPLLVVSHPARIPGCPCVCWHPTRELYAHFHMTVNIACAAGAGAAARKAGERQGSGGSGRAGRKTCSGLGFAQNTRAPGGGRRRAARQCSAAGAAAPPGSTSRRRRGAPPSPRRRAAAERAAAAV